MGMGAVVMAEEWVGGPDDEMGGSVDGDGCGGNGCGGGGGGGGGGCGDGGRDRVDDVVEDDVVIVMVRMMW